MDTEVPGECGDASDSRPRNTGALFGGATRGFAILIPDGGPVNHGT